MATAKESHARSTSHHRISMPPGSLSSLPVRQSNSRNHHSHSLSVGSLNQSHRVTRRKSMSSTNAATVAAVAAAVKDGEGSFTLSTSTQRRSTLSKAATGTKSSERGRVSGISELVALPSPTGARQGHMDPSASPMAETSAVVDESATSPNPEDAHGTSTKARMRRASEGSHLIKGEGKRVSSGELRCDKCGKGYKHSSCLTKHLWEHTPEWSYTSKLLISKHQQVQLLEAASVLVTMNQDPATPPDSARDTSSGNSSASPAASGSSGLPDDMSSAETTPPPQAEDHTSSSFSNRDSRIGRKMYGSHRSSFSRSYQSAPSSSMPGSLVSFGSPGFSHSRQPSGEQRPLPGSAFANQSDEEEAGLAAAVELLSCSFGTPRTGPVTLPPDVPPVPPLPARFLGASKNLSGSTATPSGHRAFSFAPETSSFAQHIEHSGRDRDMRMVDETDEYAMDDEAASRGKSDDDDDGVFGRMEE